MLEVIAAFALSVASAQQVPRRIDPKLPMGMTLSTAQSVPDTLPSHADLMKRALSNEFLVVVRELDAPEYAKRRDASEKLRQDDVVVEDLLAVLAKGGLSTEQQHRIVAIAVQRILTEFGALGVNMDLAMRGGIGARITGCVPGLPAEKHIQIDDIVVAIDGRAVTQPEDLTNIVQSMAPRTKVRVEILRTERDAKGKPKLDDAGRPTVKRVEVSFALASARELGEAAVGGFSRLRVSNERQEMARNVVRRYAPQPVVVVMPDDASESQKFASLDPDTHPDVQALKRQLDMYAAERRAWDANTLNALHATLTTLRRQSEDPTYFAAQRQWFARVANRFEELLPQSE